MKYSQNITHILNRKIRNLIGKVHTFLFGSDISDETFIQNCLETETNQKNLKHYFPERIQSIFFPKANVQDSDDNKIYSEQADRVCQHALSFLGLKSQNIGTPINWHCDFTIGYRWDPKTYYKDIKIPHGVADIKIPWELSRFQHLIPLGQAYQLTKNEQYAKEFVVQIEDWIKNNRPKFGVNWVCTMDVAIRACNWIAGLHYFKESSELTDAFLLQLLKSLYQHGRHIRSNLEYSPHLTSNHYLSNITGLAYLGIMFPEFKHAKEWKSFAIQELQKEMEKQVYPDGCVFEASAYYHRLSLELFFFPTLLAVINDDAFDQNNYKIVTENIFGQPYAERLYKMFEAVLYLLKPNGRMPQIGDNDNGQLHKFGYRDIQDMRHLLTFGAIFFKESKFKIKEFGFCEEALWIFGEEGKEAWDDLPESSLTEVQSRSFPDAGWHVLRDKKYYMLIACGPNGQNGNGGHAHNDKLSFELQVEGEDVLVDPGTYVYTPKPEWRNRFRSTAYHNTVTIDHEEQNRIIKGNRHLFSLTNDTKTLVKKWQTSKKCDHFIGEHTGYTRLKSPVIHRREIKFYKGDHPRWEITDKFTGEGQHHLQWNLIFPPAPRPAINITSEQLIWKTENASYSPEYGVIQDAQKLTATLETMLPYTITFTINQEKS